MPKEGYSLAFVFVVIILIVIGFLIYTQLPGTEFTLIEKPLTKTTPVEPVSFYLNVSESKDITYFGHDISVDYISSSPMQNIEVSIDNEKYLIEKEPVKCKTSCGYYKTLDDINFSVEPVIWERNSEGEMVWSFETWDTEQIYFEASANSQASSGGDKYL